MTPERVERRLYDELRHQLPSDNLTTPERSGSPGLEHGWSMSGHWGKEAIMARRPFTRRFTPSRIQTFEWLVLVGDDGGTEHRVMMQVPNENFVRRLLNIPKDTPILVGRP